jgi:hypothetical protein
VGSRAHRCQPQGGAMRSAHDCAPAGCTVEARGTTRTPDAVSVPHCAPDAQAGETYAVWLHNYVIDDVGVSQTSTQRWPR